MNDSESLALKIALVLAFISVVLNGDIVAILFAAIDVVVWFLVALLGIYIWHAISRRIHPEQAEKGQ